MRPGPVRMSSLPACGASAATTAADFWTDADPAAEEFHYPVAFDIRNLISLEDVLEELHLGPNG